MINKTAKHGEVGPGRPAGVSAGGFPRAASRTRRARFRATGAPQVPLWVVVGPTVQLGLNLPYSSLRPKQRELRFVGIHQRPPGIPASSLPTCWPPSPCARLSRARTTTGPPPHPAAIGRQRTCPPPDRLPGGEGDRGWFPRSPRNRSMREAPALTPTASPRLRRRPSAWPPHRSGSPASESTPQPSEDRALRPGPDPPDLEPVQPLRGFNH